MFEFQPPIVAGSFTDPLRLPDLPPRPLKFRMARSSQENRTVNTIDHQFCEITNLWLETPAEQKKGVAPTHQTADIPANAPTRWTFAPKVEAVNVCWEITGKLNLKGTALSTAVELKLELFRRGLSTPLWSKTMRWRAGECPIAGRTPFNGVLTNLPELCLATGTDDVTIDNAASLVDFPDGVTTIRHSPYRLKLSIVQASQYRRVPERIIHFDILAHSLQLQWAPETYLEAARPDVDPALEQKVLALETSLLQKLKQDHPNPATGVKHEVILDSNVFAIRHPGQADTDEAFATQTDFLEYQKLWGDGPRIPIGVTVLVLKSDGQSSTADVPEALYGSQILWDWDEVDENRWKAPLSAGAAPGTPGFLDQQYHKFHSSGAPKSLNCPTEYGGKGRTITRSVRDRRIRVSNNSAFPAQSGANAFPFAVEPQDRRHWASLSAIGTGPHKAKSAVIFQPSRMAGDSYRLRAYLVANGFSDTENSFVAPPRLQSDPYLFEVQRRVKVFYMVRGSDGDLGCSPAALEQTLKDTFKRELNVIVECTRAAVDNATYIQAIGNACEAGAKEASFYSRMPGLPLIMKHAVNRNPADNSPGLSCFDYTTFRANLKTDFQNGTIRKLADLAEYKKFLFEEVDCATSGAKAILLKSRDGQVINATRNDELVQVPCPPLLFLPQGQPALGTNDTIAGIASKTIEAVTVAPTRSCWGTEFRTPLTHPALNETASDFETRIDVKFGNRLPVSIQFSKGKLPPRNVSVDLSDTAKDILRQALIDAAAAIADETALFVVQIRGRSASENQKTRLTNVQTCIQEMIDDGCLIDRLRVFDLLSNGESRGWTLMDDRNYGEIITRQRSAAGNCLADLVMLEKTITEYVKLKHPNDEGIFMMHIPGEHNGYQIAGATLKPPPCTGASYAIATQDRARHVIYLATVARAASSGIASKSIPSVFVHEIAHAMFMPHAKSLGDRDPMGAQPGVHVKGDNCLMNYDLDSEHFCGFCMLRMRGWDWSTLAHDDTVKYEYQIDFQLGDFDDLFAHAPGTPNGRKERLQVAGLFSHPVVHPESDACLQFSWQYAGSLNGGAVTDPLLKQTLSGFAIEGGALPAPGNFAKLRLPKFRSLYSMFMMRAIFPEDEFKWGDGYQKGEKDLEKPYAKFILGETPSDMEAEFVRINPALGKLPLVATVKQRKVGSATPWAGADPAIGAAVYFQLIPPDPLPPYAAPGPGTVQVWAESKFNKLTPPVLKPTPGAYVDKVNNHKPTPGDPQAGNVHADFGGTRRGDGSAGTFFQKTDDGFAELPNASSGGLHKNAGRVSADAAGVAKVAFAPSRIGGDRYKLRAYVGAPTQPKDGTVPGIDVRETGTMVRWRTLRLARYIRMEPSASGAELAPELKNLTTSPCDHKPENGRVCEACMLRHRQAPTVNFDALSLELAKTYVELFLETAAQAPTSPHTLGPALKAEVNRMKEVYPHINAPFRTKKGSGGETGMTKFVYPLRRLSGTRYTAQLPCFPIDLDNEILSVRPKANSSFDAAILVSDTNGQLIDTGKVDGGVVGRVYVDDGTVHVQFLKEQPPKDWEVHYYPANFIDFENLLVFPPKSPYLFNLRYPAAYNAAINQTRPGEFMPMADAPLAPTGLLKPKAHYDYLMDPYFGGVKGVLMSALGPAVEGNKGYMPGLILVQASSLDNYMSTWTGDVQEGKSVGGTVYLFNPAETVVANWPSFNECSAALALHEFSHSMLMFHAPTVGNAKPERHDPGDTCVMSYSVNDGDYCGKCVLSMRGADISKGGLP